MSSCRTDVQTLLLSRVVWVRLGHPVTSASIAGRGRGIPAAWHCGKLFALAMGDSITYTVLTRRRVKRMTEAGTLSIVRRANTYQVRYASNNPYDCDRPPQQCP